MQKAYIVSANDKLAYIENIPAGCSHLLIACHGFLGGKENRGFINLLAQKLAEIKIGVIAFDFAGSGESTGDFADITLSRQVNNLQDIIEHTRLAYKLPMILLGRSFGGSTIVALNSNEGDIIANILWSTPIFFTRTFKNIMPGVFEQMLAGEDVTILENQQLIKIKADFALDINRHNLEVPEYVANLKKKPLLVIHGREDELVSMANADYIQENIAGATIYMVDGADHSFTNYEEDRINLTVKWLAKLINQ
ncbi:MAG: alpha/beta hydrolase [Syntrophomonadaceae bacterium]|nr:alpha/beta hydrolase [Syntrophomonadaceae bacterium]